MTKTEYLKALAKLGLTPASKATADYLGLSVRQCIRISQGHSPVPMPVALLLQMYLECGLPRWED